ncbi:LuxR C-terminal-related transcriptional regulator [uncultured Halopseudomonas sp.]|uniref:LuxR C-terminal-related transcriptional regulator n=1 Tax=uncultured Halopseudomonas sp. TaxID=2901193 RepID=UPI0030EDA023|tara:strand:- start:24910 stop:27639 length:2730 start_codon:yes stop_codon:yes gene_type:complete
MNMKGGAIIPITAGDVVSKTTLPGNDIPLLLSTKLTPPRLGRGILPRSRLEDMATQVAERRLSLLKAPPGFGKTTLATIWADRLASNGHTVAWLSLDEEDESVQRVLFYLAAALNHAAPEIGRACLSLRAELTFFTMETLASLLINELTHYGRPVVLFIDDFHRISDSVLVGALRFFLQRAPELLHVVFIGRRELPNTLLEHVYADDLLEVDGYHLRFILDETRDLLKKAGVELEQASELSAIQQGSDGWIASLRAFLLTPQINPGGRPRLATRSICILFDELMQSLESSSREHLYQLGLLDKFSIGLLAELFGAPRARQMLTLLQHRQLFISALDERENWFSLHPLFRSYLKKACIEQDESAARVLLSRAACWFAGQEHWLDAIRLGLESGHTEQVRGWINQCAMELLEQGDFTTLVMLEKRWKLQEFDAPIQLKMARAWAMGLALEVDAAQTLLAEVQSQMEPEASEKDSALYWEMQALNAMLLGLADHNERSGALAASCFEAVPHRPWVTNVLLNLMSCSHYHASRWDAFYTLPPSLLDKRQSSNLLFHDCYRQSINALAESAQGRIDPATECLHSLLARIDKTFNMSHNRPNPALVALPQALLAQLAYLRGDRQLAESYLAQCMDFIAMGGFLDCMAAAYCTSARLQWRQGFAARARRTLEQLDVLATQRGWTRLRARVLLERTWLNLRDGKHREAIACSHYLADLASDERDDVNLDRQIYAHLSALWLAVNGLETGASLLEKSSVLLVELGQRQLQIMYAEVALAAGVLFCMQGARERGEHLLSEVLSVVRETGAISVLQDLPVPDLCGALADKVSDQWWAGAQGLFSNNLTGEGVQSVCNAALLELTVKERQVMHLVAEGKSNKQIARDLNVTPETIKSHMKSIFAKLKVDNRAQAAVMLQAG